MPRSRSPASVRTTVRYYICTEGALRRLPDRLHADLISGKAAKTFANSRQQIVEAHIHRFGKRPLMVKARGVYYSFDAQGYLDVAGAAEAMTLTVDLAHECQLGENVVDFRHRLRHRQWTREHKWKASREIVRQITGDVTGVKRIRSWRP